MKTFYKYCLIFLVINFTVISVAYTQSQFQLTIGLYGDHYANSIIVTRDGGYAFAGHTTFFEGGGYIKIYVVKLNNAGMIEWATAVGGQGNDIGKSIIQTSDGGYLVGAESKSFFGPGVDNYIIKLDSSGTVLWEKVVSGFAAGEHSNDFLETVVETADSSYVISSSTSNLQGNFSGLHLFKLDVSGNVLWNKVFSPGGRHLIKTSDGGFALGGSVAGKMFMMKLDQNANYQWSTSVGGVVPQDAGRAIIQSKDGGYVLAGETVSYGSLGNMYIAKLDSLGSLEWTKYVGGNSRDVAWDVVQTPDGGYAVAGQTKSYGLQGRFNLYLVKLDSYGEVQWSRSVGTSNWNEFGLSIKMTPDEGYIISGYRSGGAGYNIFIVKFDSDGNTCSNMTSPVSPNGTGGMVVTTNVNTIFPGFLSIAPVSPTFSGVPVTSSVCILTNSQIGQNAIPETYMLSQNYPNPFNPSTVISYSIPVSSHVTLRVFDITGKEIVTLVDKFRETGNHSVEFDGHELPSGIYFYNLTVGEFSQTNRMLLLK